MLIALHQLRRYAIARSLFKPTTLKRAIDKLGFVQADPIRAPARAQDLTLRHRVNGYHAGDLERRYPKLAIEEDVSTFEVEYRDSEAVKLAVSAMVGGAPRAQFPGLLQLSLPPLAAEAPVQKSVRGGVFTVCSIVTLLGLKLESPR